MATATLSHAEMLKLIDQAQKERDVLLAKVEAMNAASKAREIPVSWKVGQATATEPAKGVIVVTGIPGAMALSATPSGWLKLLAKSDAFASFCKANEEGCKRDREVWTKHPKYLANKAARKAEAEAHKAAK